MKVLLHLKRRMSSAAQPYSASYEVDVREGSTVLELLHCLSGREPGLAYSTHHCKMGVCGGCTMLINGRKGLACRTFVTGPELYLEPAPGLPVIKDLLVDLLPLQKGDSPALPKS